MIFYYLDASAWVKCYHQEPGTAWARELLAQKPLLACASIGVVEVTATLARKQKNHAFSRSALEEKLQDLAGHWESFIQIHLLPEAVEPAQISAHTLALRGADAVHLASVLILQQRFADVHDQMIFVASDRELKAAAQTSGLVVIDPAEQEAASSPIPGSNH